MSVIDCIEDKGIKKLGRLFFVESPIDLCKLPYPGHKKGCPSIGNSILCPPHAERIKKKYNLKEPTYFIYIKFNIKNQEMRMLKLHPDWTKKQARCLLYWQNTIKKELIKLCKFYTNHRSNLNYELIPEAMGLHVFETAHYVNIPLERDYDKMKYIYKIAFIGELKNAGT